MKTLIFDLGMVLVNYRWRGFLADLGYDEEQSEKIGRAVFKNPLWNEFDLGIMGDENVIAQMKKDAPEHEKDIERIWENFRFICKPFPYSDELMRSLHEMGYKIYILSNYGKTLLSLDRQDFTFLNYVDGGVFSYEVNQMKPNDDIYQSLIKRYDIQPENSVFFDDLKDNCLGAQKAGITAVQVVGLSSILEGLKKECGIELPQMEKYLISR